MRLQSMFGGPNDEGKKGRAEAHLRQDLATDRNKLALELQTVQRMAGATAIVVKDLEQSLADARAEIDALLEDRLRLLGYPTGEHANTATAAGGSTASPLSLAAAPLSPTDQTNVVSRAVGGRAGEAGEAGEAGGAGEAGEAGEPGEAGDFERSSLRPWQTVLLDTLETNLRPRDGSVEDDSPCARDLALFLLFDEGASSSSALASVPAHAEADRDFEYVRSTAVAVAAARSSDLGWHEAAVHGTIHDVLVMLTQKLGEAGEGALQAGRAPGRLVHAPQRPAILGEIVTMLLDMVAQDNAGDAHIPATEEEDEEEEEEEDDFPGDTAGIRGKGHHGRSGANWRAQFDHFQGVAAFFSKLEQLVIDQDPPAPPPACQWTSMRLSHFAWLCCIPSALSPGVDVPRLGHVAGAVGDVGDVGDVGVLHFYLEILCAVQAEAGTLRMPLHDGGERGGSGVKGGGDNGDTGAGDAAPDDPATFPVLVPAGVAIAMLGDVCTNPVFGIDSASESAMMDHVHGIMSVGRSVGPAVDLYRYLHGTTRVFAERQGRRQLTS